MFPPGIGIHTSLTIRKSVSLSRVVVTNPLTRMKPMPHRSAHIRSYIDRHCYSLVNCLNASLRAICIVVNNVCFHRNNWVLKGIMSVTATFTIDWLVLVVACYVFSIWCVCLLFPFLNNCKACCKDLPFVELIFHVFVCRCVLFCFLFYFLLCKIVVRVLWFGRVSFLFTLLKCKLSQFRFQEGEMFSLGQGLRNVRSDKIIWL